MNIDEINKYISRIPRLPAKDFKSAHDLDSIVRNKNLNIMDFLQLSAIAVQSGIELAEHPHADKTDKEKAYGLICYGLGIPTAFDMKIVGTFNQQIARTVDKHLRQFVI